MADIVKTKGAGLPAHALAGIVARARATTPAHTGATGRARARHDLVILADISGSMEDKAGSGTKIDALAASIDSVLIDVPAADRIAFASTARVLAPGEALPRAGGGTAVHLALEAAAPYRRALVISDGKPDSAEHALRVAARIVGGGTQIDTLFIGSDSDRDGIAFMRRLADAGNGEALNVDIVRQRGEGRLLTAAIRRLALGTS